MIMMMMVMTVVMKADRVAKVSKLLRPIKSNKLCIRGHLRRILVMFTKMMISIILTIDNHIKISNLNNREEIADIVGL